MKNKKILIIGGTGFIGYHLALKCLRLKWDITSLSLNRPRKVRKLKFIKYIQCDIASKKKLTQLLKNKKFNYIVNLGGYVDHKNKKKTYNSHYIGIKNLFDIFKNQQIKSFVQIGSSNEYGNVQSPQSEEKICTPTSIYGKSKYLASNLLMQNFKKNNFPVTIIRFYQLYGPHQDLNRFIPQLIDSCLNRKKFITSKGLQYRDFLYIDDAVNGIIKCLTKKEAKGKIINLGTGRPIQLKKIMLLAEEKLKFFDPSYNQIKLRKDELQKLYPNIKLASKILNWKSKIKFEKGFQNTINYYKNISRIVKNK